jgi:hypothetical protein
MHHAEHEYQKRARKYTDEFNKANRLYNILSNLRLAAFVGIITGIVLYYLDYHLSGIVLSVCSLIFFVMLIVLHERVQNKKDLAYSLAGLNRQGLERISGKWVDFADNGEEYLNPEHQYSYDLDIFGRSSVFQWINQTFTYLGRSFLQNTLLEPSNDTAIISARQDAIHELADKLDWRQHFRAEGSMIKNGRNNPESLFAWAENENQIFKRPWPIWGIRLITSVTMISFILAYFADIRFLYIAGIMLLLQLVIFMIGLRLSSDAYGVINRHRDGIVAFRKLLAMIEKEKFRSGYLAGLKSNLLDANGNSASKQIDKLSSIADLMNFRYGQLFYFVIDVLFLFDYHCMFALEKWKKQSGDNLRPWFTVIGRFEEISSLAIIRYDNPDWCFPHFTESKQNLAAVNMGHPLLPADVRVCNNVKIKGSGHVLLITGSNMSGKSTLLRTVGVNLVLAYSGAPVCAADFTCSIMDINTAMRINDNLEKRISSFYAELLRIKTIVQAAEKSSSILFLLDEIFKGTNSRDRHTGASAVIKKLSKTGAVGLVSTHDLELGGLESDKDFDIENYHFAESYANNQIIFDYKLRSGVSKTTNALYLMRMVGIDKI